jgi:hypothetical protein
VGNGHQGYLERRTKISYLQQLFTQALHLSSISSVTMPKFGYKQLVPVANTMVIGSACFGLGVIYAQLPYDIDTLWRSTSIDAFEVALQNYKQWAVAPQYVHYILHAVMAVGLIGSFIKLYKPLEDSKYFEYGSLGLFMAAIIIYLTNLRIGVNSCLTGQWGEVDQNTGISVMAASTVMVVVVLIGVLVLQAGLYYAEWYDGEIKKEFFAKEAEAEAAAAAAASAEADSSKSTKSSAKSTGAKTSATKATKKKA